MAETRHYIGLIGGTRVTVKYGPAAPEEFGDKDPRDPIPLAEGPQGERAFAYPVSAEIAAEWVRDDD